MTPHRPATELLLALTTAKQSPKGSGERIRALEQLVVECPCFAPGLLDLGRQIQLSNEPEDDAAARASLVAAGDHLATAVEVSGRAAHALVDRAYFVDVVEDRPADAELLFNEAVERALRDLEEALVGLVRVCVEQDKMDEAKRIRSGDHDVPCLGAGLPASGRGRGRSVGRRS